MKLPSLLALFSITLLSTAGAEVLDLTTTTGRTFRRCRISKIEADGVSFRHDHGAGKLLFKQLTPALRDHFGYDPVKAEAMEAQAREERAKARAEAIKKANEAAKAQFEAMERVQEKQAVYALSSALAQLAGGQQQCPWIQLTGSAVLPGTALGGNGYCTPQVPWCGAWSQNLGRPGCGYVQPAPCTMSGYRPVPFFAVPGIGPNVMTPSVPCVPPTRVVIQAH